LQPENTEEEHLRNKKRKGIKKQNISINAAAPPDGGFCLILYYTHSILP
jgi:hypothetical protein